MTTAPNVPSSSSSAASSIQLSFADFEDLTKRLVLMPRIEDEGVGAVVASYIDSVESCSSPEQPQSSSATTTTTIISTSDTNHNNNQKKEAEPHASKGDNFRLSTVSSDSTECRDEKEETPTTSKSLFNPQQDDDGDGSSLVGCILVGTNSSLHNNKNDSLEHAEFSDILAAIRSAAQQEGPLVLHLERPTSAATLSQEALRLEKSSSSSSGDSSSDDDDNNDDDDDGTDDCSTVSCHSNAGSLLANKSEQHEQQPAETTQPQEENNITPHQQTISSPSLLSGRLANWGSRMRVGAQFAAHAASTAATQAAHAAAEARRAQQQQQQNITDNNKEKPVGLHVQTSLGAFLPLTAQPPSSWKNSSSSTPTTTRGSNSELNITSSSVLYVRKSAVEPCPPSSRGFAYQWYKGVPTLTEDAPLEDWILLPDANWASYQPTTTDVGYQLLCMVTMDRKWAVSSEDDDDDSDSDSDDSDEEECNNNNKKITVRCMTPHVVAADHSLFNGARQALVRGAHFGQLEGQGKAQGRTFRLQVEMGSQKKRVASAVKLDQVVGGTAEPLHDGVFHRMSASSHHGGSKGLALKFRPGQVSDACMVSALLSEDGALELIAPNRFARESLLLAIGIANFTGKPSELEPTTILYHCDENNEDILLDDASSSGSDDGSKSSIVSRSTAATPVKEEQAGPQLVDRLVLSPAKNDIKDDDASVLSQSSHGDLSAVASLSAAEPSATATQQQQPSESNERQTELEKEIEFLRSKLAKKDKVVSELQRQVTRSDSAVQQANQKASLYEQQVQDVQAELHSCQNVYRAAQQAVEDQTDALKKMKSDHSAQILKLKEQVESQATMIAEMEKTVKSHKNEKAVLAAAVEARESKLTKMAELQESYVSLSSKVSQQDQWRKELQETTERYNELKADLHKVTLLEKECRSELETSEQTIRSLHDEVKSHKEKAETCEKELGTVQSKNQKLKAERNSYKQKADSLSKEISRICRNGRTLADIERTLANEGTLKEEVELLRKQKRKALEDCHSYRKSYEQNRAAQQIIAASPSKSKANPQHDPTLIMERNVELERLVTELTEYVNAKEMQLETLVQVNAALQEEIHGLAKANMNINEV